MPSRNLASRAARWSARHRKTAVFGWLAFVAIAFVIGGAVGQKKIADENQGNGSSRTADRAIAKANFPDKADEQVLVQGRGAIRIGSPQLTAGVKDVVNRLEHTPNVVDVKSPLANGNAGQLSKDGRSALVSFSIPGKDDVAKARVGATLAATAAAQKGHPELRIEQFGDASADKALSKMFSDDFSRAQKISLPLTLVILVVAFGALMAAGVPLLLGMTAVLATLGLIAPISQLVPVDDSISEVILLIGLAVGVDYSLFYLRRKMEESDAGRSEADALEFAAATSGRAVLISGLTVMIAMAGMLFAGNVTFTSFAVGTMLVVAVAMLGSLTVLPAVLSKLGRRVELGKVPFLAGMRHRNHGESRVWGFVVDRVLRRPVLSVVLSAGVLLVLAAPALNIHTINTGVAGLPRSLAIMQTYDRIQAAFPGGPLPATIAVQADDVTAPQVQQGIKALEAKALATHEMSGPVDQTIAPDHTVSVVNIPMHGDGTDDVSDHALATLRNDVIPATIAKVPGVKVDVSGMTAGSKDFNDSMKSHIPYVFAFVLGFAFLLLLVTFRSIVIPLQAIVLNLLSVGAAYGVLVWIFQDGHLQSLLGFKSLSGIVAWLPLFLFVILFGLSMDYHVFIISRIKEAVDRGAKTEDAVRQGLHATAGVVTSAAVVMVAVFAVFASLTAMEFKQMGVGLALAILIDATIVRAVLLPATMKLLGKWNWYLPKKLNWLPRFSHEPHIEPARA